MSLFKICSTEDKQRLMHFISNYNKKMKPPQDLANLNMDNINIFDFMQRDEEKKRRDKEALEENTLRELQIAAELRGRR